MSFLQKIKVVRKKSQRTQCPWTHRQVLNAPRITLNSLYRFFITTLDLITYAIKIGDSSWINLGANPADFHSAFLMLSFCIWIDSIKSSESTMSVIGPALKGFGFGIDFCPSGSITEFSTNGLKAPWVIILFWFSVTTELSFGSSKQIGCF